jgi:hypothetical protein
VRERLAKLWSRLRRNPWGLTVVACGLVAAGLGVTLLVGRALRRPALAEAARAAARRAELPEGLVLAVAYADTRGRAAPMPTREGGQGWVRLHEAFGARSPKAGAALMGADVARVRAEPALGLEAAARLLASTPEAPPPGRRADPGAWDAALRRFFGFQDPVSASLYADGVLRLWRGGFRGTDEAGAPFAAAAAGGEAAPLTLERAPPLARGAPGVAFVGSALGSHRPPKEGGPREITHVVVHTTELPFASTVAYFRGPRTAVGSHYGLRAQDGLVVQFIDEAEVAFHDACFNENSIGIEHEAVSAAGRAWFTDELYRASAELVVDIAMRTGVTIDREHIVGHGEAPDCSDHTDPGPDWDWDLYMRYVHQAYAVHPIRDVILH